MTDWQQPGQPERIVMPPPVAASPARPRGGALKIVMVVLLVLALMGSGLLNLVLLVMLTSGEGVGMKQTDLEEVFSSGTGGDKVAIVTISGILAEGMGPFGDEGNYAFIGRQLKQAEEDRSVKAVVIEVDSPGGGVTASDVLAHKIAELAKEKKVVVSMKGLAASGGYYVSAGADVIYAQPTTITGSIGVIYTSVNVKELMDKIGVSPVVIKSGALKDFGSIFREMRPEERAMIQGIIDDAFARFKTVVSKGRKMKMEDVDRVATGGVFTAQQAMDLKLIDKIGYLDDAIKEAKDLAGLKQQATVIRYEERRGLLGLLLRGQETASVGRDVTVRLNAPGADWPKAGLYYMWEPALMDRR